MEVFDVNEFIVSRLTFGLRLVICNDRWGVRLRLVADPGKNFDASRSLLEREVKNRSLKSPGYPRWWESVALKSATHFSFKNGWKFEPPNRSVVGDNG